MKIAVVGSGGAGMTAAWLLDEKHEVTLFERNAVLGGHAHSTRVEQGGHTHFADDGFAWFSDALYPTFMRLLELHGVATRIVPMSATFTQKTIGRTYVLPPTGLGPLLRTFSNPGMVAGLLRLNHAINLAKPVVHGHDLDLSWGEFLDRHKFPEPFRSQLLTPMVAGVWGGPYDRVRDFSAYTLMKYLVFHRPSGLEQYKWHVIRDGAASYIRQVAGTLRRTEILQQTAVTRLQRTADGWQVTDSQGVTRAFDHVVLATGARDAQQILRDVDGVDTVKQVLGGFEYYTVRLGTHSDPSFLPPRRSDWRVANLMWDGRAATLNVWTGKHTGQPVFTSYLQDREPAQCHNISTFHLPLITPAHNRAQGALAALQGRENLWLIGDWTHDIGCHEDAIVSALQVAQRLDPQLSRIALLQSPRQHPAMHALPEQPTPPLLSP